MIKFFKQLWCYLMLTTDAPVSPMQKILNKVIAKGYYTNNVPTDCTSRFMCTALKYAAIDGIITYREFTYAKRLIEEYIKGEATLRDKRVFYGLPSDHKYLLATYTNWDKRPAFKIDIHA